MIRKINKIKDFGVFDNFRWLSGCPIFGKHNLIYGWNYSGKTSISRIFRSFELTQKHEDYLSAEFELEDDKAQKHSEKDLSTLPNIRVFNIDFIYQNLKWFETDSDVEPIFILGEENIELQKKLDELKVEKSNLVEEKESLKNQRSEAEMGLETAFTQCARDIKTALTIPNYDKDKLKPEVNSIKDDYTQYLLSDTNYNKNLTVYKNTEKRDEINLRNHPLFIFAILQEKAKNLIERKITAQKIIEELKNDERLNEWVKEGKSLHKEKTKCSFCGNNLPSDLLEKLNKHFSDEYQKLDEDIKKLLIELEDYKSDLNFSIPVKGELYKEFTAGYEDLLKKLTTWKEKYLINIDKLIERLKEKKAQPFNVPRYLVIADYSDNLEKIYQEVVSLCSKHNEKTANFEKDKKDAEGKLVKHFAGKFIRDQKYLELIKQREDIASKMSVVDTKFAKIASDISEIAKKLSESVKGAEKINEYIEQFFQHDGIRFEVLENNQFRMSRNGLPAKNLSEGEKTAISLAYFIAKLEDTQTKLEETIVFIDDPVSSLDCNHLFNVYAFVKSKLGNCLQLFITTHNLEFLNLMKDFLVDSKDENGKGYDKKTAPWFFVRREQNETTDRSIIENLPKELRIFRSEYVYLFSIILDFHNKPSGSNYDRLYFIPNVLRRFLEGYLGLRYPDAKPWSDKLDKLVGNETERNMVFKLVNEFSHNKSATGALKFPEIVECEKAVKIVIDNLKNNDLDHYDCLYGSCQ